MSEYEFLQAQKVILKHKMQEAVEMLEAEKRKIKERHKMDMVLNAKKQKSAFHP